MENINEEELSDRTLVFFVNGKRISIQNPPQDKTLIQFLRSDLGLTGTKLACGEGSCGACTVTLARPGKSGTSYTAINACFVKICSLHGTAITTSEGLAKEKGSLHPIQERLHLAHGVQCGFCTSGMVMSMHSRLRDENCPPPVDVEDIVKAIDGNLCRCTGYRPILEAFTTFCDDATEDVDKNTSSTFDRSSFKEYCPEKDDPELPPELKNGGNLQNQFLKFVDPSKGTKWFRPTTLSELASIQKDHETFRRFMGGTGGYKRDDFSYNHPVTVQLDSIPDLMNYEETPHGWYFGSGLTLTEWSRLLGKILKDGQTRSEGELSIIRAYSKALETLGSTQIRNVARIGGSVFYTHPCSDLLPLHIACDAWIELQSVDNQRKIVHIDETFCNETAQKIQDGSCVVVKLVLPKPKKDENVFAAFFRKARRKNFDLAILNAAFLAKLNGNNIEKITVVIGGADQVLINSGKVKGPVVATNTVKALTGMDLVTDNVESDALRDAVFSDVTITEGAPGNFGILRKTLAFTFVTDFLKSLCDGKVLANLEEHQRQNKKFHQLFRKVDSNQPVYDLVERPVAHMWASEMVKGSAVFTDDLEPLKSELTAILIRSTQPHAEILSIDFSEALKVSGVEDVVSAADLSAEENTWGIGGFFDEDVFAAKTVVHHGQVIAALLCSDVKAGRLAAQKVVIQYKPLPFILGVREEERKGSDLDSIGVVGELGIKRFQDESLLEKEGIQIISGTISIGRQEHAYMETHSALVIPVGEKDEYVCYYTTQEPMTVQTNVSRVLGVPKNKVIVKTKRTGGGFGGKERLHTALIAAAGARKTGRSVRCILSRREDMSMTGHRHEILVRYNVTFDPEDGRILKSEFNAYSNAGHSIDLSLPWIIILLLRMDGGYTIPNYEGKGKALRTNVPSNTAMRGFGGPEGAIVIEEIIHRIAHILKKDPNEIKKVNMTREGDQLHHGNTKVIGCTLEKCWQECLERSNFEQKKKSVEDFNANNKRKKKGLSLTPMKFAPSFFCGFLNQASAFVRIYLDGTVLISHGGAEMGQGLHTKMIQIASRELAIDASKIHINDTSTETIANATPTGGSVGSDMNGAALINACKILKDRLEPIKSRNPDGNWEAWIFQAYQERINLNALGFYDSSNVDFNFFLNSGTSFDYFVFGVGCVEVEVDCHTGDITVLSVDIVMDVGRSLNPAIDIGQIEGAFMQGMGYVTNEQLINSSRDGKLLTDNFGTYKIPTASDIPNEINVTLLDNGENDVKSASSVYSSKGIGEPPIVLCAGIVSAVREAITSYRNDQGLFEWFDLSVPMTADKVRLAASDKIVSEALKTIPDDEPKWAHEV